MARAVSELKRLVDGDAAAQGYAPYGFIYFIEADGAKRIKIGWTDNNPRARLTHLQVASPFPLKPLGVIVGPFCVETQMHDRFASLRRCGEWFHAAPVLRKFIATSTRDWPRPDQRIIRPGYYQIDYSEAAAIWVQVDIRCDRCRAVVAIRERAFACESSQGDKIRVCRSCATDTANNVRRGSVHLSSVNYDCP